jgi:hypothetical protein
LASFEELMEKFWTRDSRPLTIRVRRSSESADATALINRIYRVARTRIEEMAYGPGDGQVTTDYISDVGGQLLTESVDSGETVLAFLFKDYGTMCPLGSRACRHWFELAFTQTNLAYLAKEAGFELAEKPRTLAEVLVTSSPLVYLDGVLVACERKGDGALEFIVDHGYKVPTWNTISSEQQQMITGLIERQRCGCSLCEALA